LFDIFEGIVIPLHHGSNGWPVFGVHVYHDVVDGVVHYAVYSTCQVAQIAVVRPDMSVPKDGAITGYGVKTYTLGI